MGFCYQPWYNFGPLQEEIIDDLLERGNITVERIAGVASVIRGIARSARNTSSLRAFNITERVFASLTNASDLLDDDDAYVS